MKSAGEIYRKLKEAKFRHWLVFYKGMSKRTPENCKYNYLYNFVGNDHDTYLMRLCLLHQNGVTLENGIIPHLVDVCQTDQLCQTCNGFIQKYSREEIKKLFISELETKKIKEKKYPEICALEWVLEKYNESYPPISWFQTLYFIIKKTLLRIKI